MSLCGHDDVSKRRRRRWNEQEQRPEGDDMSSSRQQADVHADVLEQRQVKGSLRSILLAGRSARAWKPVIDGKLQRWDMDGKLVSGGEMPSASSSMQSPSPSTSSKSQQQRQQGNGAQPSEVKMDADETNDSDSEFRKVPEMPAPDKSLVPRTRKRPGGVSGGAANDKEGKRLKRLLRNRVSAQQARERKKAYLIDLEYKAKQLELRNAELEEKNATLQRENHVLRQIVKNTTMAHKAAGE